MKKITYILLVTILLAASIAAEALANTEPKTPASAKAAGTKAALVCLA